MKLTIPISVGELLDKISILQIKSQYTENSFIIKELNDLINIAKSQDIFDEEEFSRLLEINQKLWKIEDEIRVFEQKHIFDDDFITCARLVYTYNDERAKIKKEINEKYHSEYQEVKFYLN